MTLPLPDIPIRWHIYEDRIPKVFPEVVETHPLAEVPCPACGYPLANGEPVALLVLGPGADPEAQAKCRRAAWFTAAGIALHAACAGVP